MGFHHVALATRDAAATHRFYTEVMGFHLQKVVVLPNPPVPPNTESTGFSKHFFYATDESPNGETGMMAFWDISDASLGDDYTVNLNKAIGLPWWVNHIAFDAPSMDVLHAHRDRWRSHGYKVLEIDHEFCVSIYITDPNGNMVEFCHSTRPFTDEERDRAVTAVLQDRPSFDDEKSSTQIWEPIVADEPVGADV